MARRVVVGDLRVQQIDRRDGRRSWTIVWPEGTEHAEADRFLRRHEGSGTQRTYAYVLVDHLLWLVFFLGFFYVLGDGRPRCFSGGGARLGGLDRDRMVARHCRLRRRA